MVSWSHLAALLKAVPLSAQHLIESMFFLACVLSLAGGHLLSLVPPFGIPYHLMSAILSPRLSFALCSELTSSALPMDSSYFPASVGVYALLNFVRRAISNYSCIVLYSISWYSVVARNFLWGFGIDNNVFGDIKCCYFCAKWKMEHFYIKHFFFPKPMGAGASSTCIGWCINASWSK